MFKTKRNDEFEIVFSSTFDIDVCCFFSHTASVLVYTMLHAGHNTILATRLTQLKIIHI